jgi:hypothetical protein
MGSGSTLGSGSPDRRPSRADTTSSKGRTTADASSLPAVCFDHPDGGAIRGVQDVRGANAKLFAHDRRQMWRRSKSRGKGGFGQRRTAGIVAHHAERAQPATFSPSTRRPVARGPTSSNATPRSARRRPPLLWRDSRREPPARPLGARTPLRSARAQPAPSDACVRSHPHGPSGSSCTGQSGSCCPSRTHCRR